MERSEAVIIPEVRVVLKIGIFLEGFLILEKGQFKRNGVIFQPSIFRKNMLVVRGNYFPFGKAYFQGRTVSFRECKSFTQIFLNYSRACCW